jgi:Fe2+ or Zn2+ uptake regulation protein
LDRTTIEQAIAARGLRITRQRRAILDVLERSHSQTSALQLYDAVRSAHPEIGLTTVYRTLALLEGIGAVRRLHGGEACETVVSAHHPHGHSVVCESCGAVEEFTACDIAAIAAAATAETGFAITDHFLQLSGTCEMCSERKTVSRAAPARHL